MKLFDKIIWLYSIRGDFIIVFIKYMPVNPYILLKYKFFVYGNILYNTTMVNYGKGFFFL